MRFVSVARFIITAIAALALVGCVSDPNNLNKRAPYSTSQLYLPELTE
jgi:starvation-inducible outer membrane lipoprotein